MQIVPNVSVSRQGTHEGSALFLKVQSLQTCTERTWIITRHRSGIKANLKAVLKMFLLKWLLLKPWGSSDYELRPKSTQRTLVAQRESIGGAVITAGVDSSDKPVTTLTRYSKLDSCHFLEQNTILFATHLTYSPVRLGWEEVGWASTPSTIILIGTDIETSPSCHFICNGASTHIFLSQIKDLR